MYTYELTPGEVIHIEWMNLTATVLAVADSDLVILDHEDNQVWSIGHGPIDAERI